MAKGRDSVFGSRRGGRKAFVLPPSVPAQLVDDVVKAHDSLDGQSNRLALRKALDVDRVRGEENGEFVQQSELPGARRRGRPIWKSGAIPQQSHFLVDHHAQWRRVKIKKIACWEIAPFGRGPLESIRAAQVNHKP